MEQCIRCGNVATLLCDYIIGWPHNKDEPKYADAKALPFRCDAPLCDNCGKQVGTMYFHGKHSGGDTIDHCMIHADAGREKIIPMSLNDAITKRRLVHCELRRLAMHIVSSPQPSLSTEAPNVQKGSEATNE